MVAWCKSGTTTPGPGTSGPGIRDPPQSLKVAPQYPLQNLKVGSQDPLQSLKVDPHNNISSLLDLFCSGKCIYNMEIIFHE